MTLLVLAVALLYGALELAALLLFLRPYAHQGLARRCDTPSRRALRLLFCVAMAFAFAALRVGQSLPGMVLNILLHFAAVALTGFTLYDLPLTQMLNSSLVFHLSLDMCKSLLWDILPFLKSFRMESSALDQLMLTLPLMALQALCCLALRQTACAPHDRRMNRTMAALIFLPAVPYLYVKSLQYRSFMIGDVSYSGAMSALCFLVCLLAVAVSLLSNRLVAGIDRERRAEHEHMTLERLEAQMAQHQQQIDNINKLSHDMRNHLATLAAMGGSKEAADYIAALTPPLCARRRAKNFRLSGAGRAAGAENGRVQPRRRVAHSLYFAGSHRRALRPVRPGFVHALRQPARQRHRSRVRPAGWRG